MSLDVPTAAPTAASQPLLAMTGISKRFPGVQALADVSLDVQAGEVHAVVGENGAGKSTLMHILAGVHQPDSGHIDFVGQSAVSIADEQVAQRMGIAIVYQERSLFDSLSVAENIFAGRQPVHRANWIDRTWMDDEARELLARVRLTVHPRALLSSLSPAEQQLVEIAKALSLRARLIIFDEPTAALTEFETKNLFAVVRSLQRQGAALIYISHRLEEIFAIADRVTVLKDGRGQGTFAIGDTNPPALIQKMVGRDLQPVLRTRPAPASQQHASTPALEVQQLTSGGSSRAGGVVLKQVHLRVAKGEIVALAGLSGAGRSETALSIFGARPFVSGNIQMNGRQVAIRSVPDAIAAGIGYLPEDRKLAGLFLEMSIAHNIAVTGLSRFGRVLTSDRAIAATADDYRSRLRIASRSASQAVRSLSGGNQQKVLLAKWLLVEPRVLFVDEPTRGVDVGAKAEVHRLLVELAERGTALIVISSDLTEVLALADRVVVMARGQVAGELDRGAATEERIIHLASAVPTFAAT